MSSHRLLVKTRVLALLLASTATTSYAQWNAPYDSTPLAAGQKPSVGYLLEGRFANVLQQCGVGNFKGMKIPGRFHDTTLPDKSAIPAKLQTQLGLPLDELIDAQIHQSIGRVFAYLYTEADVANIDKTEPLFSKERVLLLDQDLAKQNTAFSPIRDPSTMVDDDSQSYIYSSSCDAIFSAAANATGGIQLPPVKIQGALAGSYSTENKDAVQIVRSRQFNSPLQDMFDQDIWADYGDLLLWQLYANSTNIANGVSKKTNYYLKQAPAVVVLESSRFDKNASASVALGATTATIFASGDASFKASLASSNSGTFKDAQTLFVTGFLTQKSDLFQVAPGPKAIAKSIASDVQLRMDSHPGIFLPGANTITVLAPAVPTTLCTSGLWNSQVKDGNGASLSYVSATRVDPDVASNPPACRFTLNLTIPPAIPPATQPLSVKYDIQVAYGKKLLDTDGNQYELAFTGSTSDLSLSGSPTYDISQLADPSFGTPKTETTAPGSTKYSFQWSREISLQDTLADLIDLTSVSLTKSAIKCDADLINNSSLSVTTSTPSAANPHRITITAVQSTFDISNVDSKWVSSQNCSINLTVQLRMTNGRNFSFDISDWKVKGPGPVPVTPPPAH